MHIIMKQKNLIAVLLTILLAGGIFFHTPQTAEANESVQVYVNGQKLNTDVEPLIENGRTMVPLRAIFEAVGAEVQWDAENRIAFAHRKGTEVLLKIGSLNPTVNGRVWPLDVPAQIVKDRTLAPLRFVGEAFGGEVGWDPNTRTATITMQEDNQVKALKVSGEAVNLRSGAGLSFGILGQIPADVKLAILEEKDDWYQVNYSGRNGWVAGWLVDIIWEEIQPVTDVITDPVVIEDSEIVDDQWESITILGESMVNSAELKRLVRMNNPDAPDLADLYIKIGREYGIRGDIAYCQAAKETGWWKYGGLVLPEQNNYCGLSATGAAATAEEDLRGADPDRVWFEEGKHGAFFDTPATGVEAHIQHLYAYASTAPLPAGKDLLSPRFSLVKRGNSKYWEDLGGKWAVPGYDRNKYPDFTAAFANQDTYGHSIINDYYKKVWQPVNNSAL